MILDWVPIHFATDELGLAYFDGTHLYEHADPRRASTRTGAATSSTTAGTRCGASCSRRRMFWLDKYHIDGLRVDAVASMLYLDYSRKEGEWMPNQYGGKENIEAISFLRRFNEEVYRHFPDVQTYRRGIDRVGDGVAADVRRRARLRLQVGHGLDARHAEVLRSYDPIHRKYHQNDLTFRMLYAYNENFVLPLSHDEVVHGKGPLWDKMAGDEWQKFAGPAAAVRATSGG